MMRELRSDIAFRINGLTRQERLTFLNALYHDVRGSWGDPKLRLQAIKYLTVNLRMPKHVELANKCIEYFEDGDLDGRQFRTSHENGGYVGLDEFYGIEMSIMNKSSLFYDFMIDFDYMFDYPENLFDDWDEYYDKKNENKWR